ncbi:hypothetical protein [Campylobacter estrildidarum]|uniref:EF-hand domain-containing protein n=1 Tax=Campylobacter estrildidarum TaxID=2510189 RepID=A0A4U7BIB2_9BACT|nr:hypothetical protein [Campylobacter estrildidarum]TKX31533.1 hypothetical protein CQA69_02635 [Campylobacter estrildidarum]
MKIAKDVTIIGLNDVMAYSKRAYLDKKDFQDLKQEEFNPEDFLVKLDSKREKSGIKVIFEDEESSLFVSLNLTKSNFQNILKHFGDKEDYFLREDGSIRLNGKAQNFVAGWFKNAAYDLNYLKADADKNGIIKGKENNNLYLYNLTITPDNPKGGANDLIRQLYITTGGKSKVGDDGKERDLESALNALLTFDKNADGKITVLEIEGSKDRILADAQTMFDNGNSVSKTLLQKLKKMQEEIDNASDEQEDSDIKNKALDQGLSALNMQELLKFKQKYPDEYEKLKQKDLEDLSKNLSFDLQKEIDYGSLEIIDKLV